MRIINKFKKKYKEILCAFLKSKKINEGLTV